MKRWESPFPYGLRSSLCFLLACCFSLLAPMWVGSQTTPTSPEPPLSWTSSDLTTMPSWDDLEQASATLSQKATDLLGQAQDLNSQLAQLQSSLTDSTTLLAQSLAMRKQEAILSDRILQTKLNENSYWRDAAILASSVAIGTLADSYTGALWSTGVGLILITTDQVFRFFKIWR